MGDIISTPSSNSPSNPKEHTATKPMSSSSSSESPKPPKSETPIDKSQNPEPEPEPEPSDPTSETENQGEEEEEEEGECPFCAFMKGGGCREAFIKWEDCVQEGEEAKEDIVEKCYEITSLLKECMDKHADYYAPILRAEKAAEEEVKKQLESEAAAAAGGDEGSSEKATAGEGSS